MARFRKRPVVIEATQWFKNGDHPNDDCYLITDRAPAPPFLSEGKVVRYFRRPDVLDESACISSIPCEHMMHEHGWIDTPEGGHNVCPGDWIITGVNGETYPCKPEIFSATYEKAENKMSNTFSYVKYDDESTKKQEAFKAAFEKIEELADTTLADGRAKSLLKTHLEVAYMWTGKAIRDEQIERDSQPEHVAERTPA